LFSDLWPLLMMSDVVIVVVAVTNGLLSTAVDAASRELRRWFIFLCVRTLADLNIW
jgi:hypothetical protein